MDQLSFNDIPPPQAPARSRREDPETSRDAARSVDVARLEGLVLAALRRRPMTTKELSAELGIARVSVSPRIAPLREKGFVRASGLRREKSTVWEAV